MTLSIALMFFLNAFNDGMVSGWAAKVIDQEVGHFRLWHREVGRAGLSEILIHNPDQLRTELLKNPNILEAMPCLWFGGMIGDDSKSTNFPGIACDLKYLDRALPGLKKNNDRGADFEIEYRKWYCRHLYAC